MAACRLGVISLPVWFQGTFITCLMTKNEGQATVYSLEWPMAAPGAIQPYIRTIKNICKGALQVPVTSKHVSVQADFGTTPVLSVYPSFGMLCIDVGLEPLSHELTTGSQGGIDVE
ncbi:unnamed protein product [Pleuronectes platessa]|uniref:Uncharacterized protein n=1 Tax=Pleuronectes platessa TaxID=8262 RepID=A0A9N7UEA1_PLEPL|nr:unnamed protein product [Pleuronectes platessa]